MDGVWELLQSTHTDMLTCVAMLAAMPVGAACGYDLQCSRLGCLHYGWGCRVCARLLGRPVDYRA